MSCPLIIAASINHSYPALKVPLCGAHLTSFSSLALWMGTMKFKLTVICHLFGCLAVEDTPAIACAYLHEQEGKKFRSAAVPYIRWSICKIFNFLGLTKAICTNYMLHG